MHYGPYAFSKNGLRTIDTKVSQLYVYPSHQLLGPEAGLWSFFEAMRLIKRKKQRKSGR
jgi:hypothetical protein